MKIVGIHKAKTHLSKLIQQVLDGEEVYIAKNGKALVCLKACKPSKQRTPGALKGKIWMADDFNELPEEVTAAFRGEAE